MKVLGVDPGREKTGVAVVGSDGHVYFQAIVETPRLVEVLEPLVVEWEISRIALGNSTSSKEARVQIELLCGKRGWENVRIELVDETNSTLEARGLYFEANPPRGWRKLIPTGAQVPPVPVDDFAAIIVARRLLFGFVRDEKKR